MTRIARGFAWVWRHGYLRFPLSVVAALLIFQAVANVAADFGQDDAGYHALVGTTQQYYGPPPPIPTSGGGGSNPTPTTTPVPTATNTPVPTATNTPVPTPTPSVAFWRVYAGEYSYDDANCSVKKDPITMIIRQVGETAATHVTHHGSLNEDDPVQPALALDVGNPQYYYEVTRCTEGQVSQANKGDNCGLSCFPPFTPNSRWHMRCRANGAIADPAGGTFAACTPHYDQAAGCGHVVQATFGDTWPGLNPNGSGFDAGRDYLYYLLVTVGGHQFQRVQYWGNRDKMLQCDNQTWSGSNGYVNEIGG